MLNRFETEKLLRYLLPFVLLVYAISSVTLADEPPVNPGDAARLREAFAREAWFVAQAGELSRDQTDALAAEGLKTLDRWNGQVNDPALAAAFRRELTFLTKTVSPSAWEKLQAERERLEARGRHAAVLAQVAELDEAVILTSEQRAGLCAELSTLPWQPRNCNMPLAPVRRLPALISAGGLQALEIAEARMAAVLQPAQLAAYQQLTDPAIERTIVLQQGPQGTLTAERPSFKEQQQRLKVYLERLMDATGSVCRLNDIQREKLSLAGELDIERFREQYLAIQSRESEDSLKKAGRLTVLGEAAHAMFSDPASSVQRAIRALLTDDQVTKLTLAELQRHAFRRRALVEAAVVGFERSAALTSAQCAELERTLDKALADCRVSPQWQMQCVRTMTGLPRGKLRPILADQQWPAFERQLTRLDELARRLEEELEKKVGVLRGVKIMALDKDGNLEAELWADEIRLNLD